MPLQLYQLLPVYNDRREHTATVVWGKILCFHVHDEVLSEGGKTVDINKLRPMSRAGGNTYVTVGRVFDMARPRVP